MWMGLRCQNSYGNQVEWVSQSSGQPLSYDQWGSDEPSSNCDGKAYQERLFDISNSIQAKNISSFRLLIGS